MGILLNTKHFNNVTLTVFVCLISSGFIIHILNPSNSISSKNHIGPGEEIIVPIPIEDIFLRSDYYINLRIGGNFIRENTTNGNITVIVLTEEELSQFQTNDSLFIGLQGTIDEEYDSLKFNDEIIKLEASSLKYYVIIQNNFLDSNWFYFYYIGIVSNTYYIGLGIGFLGFVGLIIVLMIRFEGVKRSFTFAIGINILFILFRMSTLGKYNSLDLRLYYDLIFKHAITPELWNDFEAWYLPWIDSFLQGNFPYGELTGYEFPPLFIITLGIFELLPIIPIWRTGIPIFLAHIFTGIVIYYIIKEFYPVNKKKVEVGVLFYFLNPISLAYGSFCWLNPPLFILFTVLAFYFIIRRKKCINLVYFRIPSYQVAMLSLGIATMYKQFAFTFFFPLILIQFYRHKTQIKDLLYGSLSYCVTILVICLPFLIIDFPVFIQNTLFSTTAFTVERTKIVHFAFPVNFNTFFAAFYFPDLITDIIGFLLVWWIPLFIFIILIYVNLRSDLKSKIGDKDAIIICWLIVLILCVHLFYPRGSYKYYLLFLMPFFSIFVGQQRYKNTILLLIFLIVGFIVLVNRFIYFNFLVLVLAYIIFQLHKIRHISSRQAVVNPDLS